MTYSFPAGIRRLLTLALLASASLLATACHKDDATPDYSAQDDATIQKYVAANTVTNAQKQPSGLYYVPLTVPNTAAPLPTVGQIVSVLYTGYLLDGTVFDASSNHGNEPLNFALGKGQLIAGFDQGVALMHKGDKASLLIPSGLAYGPAGAGSAIPPNTVLRFDVELVDINFASINLTDDIVIQKYLTANKITTAQKQPSGLYYVPTTTNPAGVPATAGKTAFVKYTGYLMDGSSFDSATSTPYSFQVGAGKVIAGFDQGVALMRTGEKATLLIPSSLAYGATGSGAGIIPPYSVLRFTVELVDVQ